MITEGDFESLEGLEELDEELENLLSSTTELEENIEKEATEEAVIDNQNGTKKEKRNFIKTKRKFNQAVRILREKYVRMNKDLSKSTAGGIEYWLTFVPVGDFLTKKSTLISPSIGIYFGVYAGSKNTQVNGYDRTLPVFNWDDENKYWFTGYVEVYNFVHNLIAMVKAKKGEKTYNNPGKKKDITIKAHEKGISFYFKRTTENGVVKSGYTVNYEEIVPVLQYIMENLKAISGAGLVNYVIEEIED